MGKEWIKIKEIGQLYLEKVLVSFDKPILFVCTDYENRRYLCLDVEDDNERIIVAQVDVQRLVDMIENRVTMEEVFRTSTQNSLIVAEYDYANREIVSTSRSSQHIEEDSLPKKGAYFELWNDEIKMYNEFLKTQMVMVDYEEFYNSSKLVVEITKSPVGEYSIDERVFNCIST